MRALTFWKTVVRDKADFLENFVGLLRAHGIRFCVIGGHAVNAYVEPVVTLDLEIVVAVDQIEQVEALLASHFQVKRFAHSINVSLPGSDLQVQIQTDPRYAGFIERASEREVLGMVLPVASLGGYAAREDLGGAGCEPKAQQAPKGPGRHRQAVGGLPGAPRAGAGEHPEAAADLGMLRDSRPHPHRAPTRGTPYERCGIHRRGSPCACSRGFNP